MIGWKLMCQQVFFRLVVVVFRGADLLWAAPLGLGGAMSVEWPVMATPGSGFLLYWANGLLSLLSACLEYKIEQFSH